MGGVLKILTISGWAIAIVVRVCGGTSLTIPESTLGASSMESGFLSCVI